MFHNAIRDKRRCAISTFPDCSSREMENSAPQAVHLISFTSTVLSEGGLLSSSARVVSSPALQQAYHLLQFHFCCHSKDKPVTFTPVQTLSLHHRIPWELLIAHFKALHWWRRSGGVAPPEEVMEEAQTNFLTQGLVQLATNLPYLFPYH